MKKFLLWAALLISPSMIWAQVTTGYHRVGQVIARGSSGTQAVVVPNANVFVTSTATGTVATIYSDPLLSIPITTGMVTADASGNYSYYMPLAYCANERVQYPGSGNFTTTNICALNGGMIYPAAGLAASTGTAWRAPVYGDVVTLFGGGTCSGFLKSDGTCATPTTVTIQTNGVNNTSQSLLNHVDTATVKFTNPSGGVESATVPNATNNSLGAAQCDGTTTTCSSGVISASATGSFSTQVIPPVAGQSVVIYPTSHVENFPCGSGTATASNTGGFINYVYGGTGSCTYSITWSGFSLPSYITAGNVTSVQAFATTSVTPTVPGNQGAPSTGCSSCSSNLSPTGATYYWPMTQNVSNTSYTGTTLTSATITAQITGSVIGSKSTSMTISSVGLILYYIGPPPPANTNVLVAPPLSFNSDTLTLSLTTPVDLGIDSGAANAYVVSVSGLGLSPGTTVKFIPAHASTSTTPTFSLNGLSALTIVGPTGSALASGDLNTSAPAILVYGATGVWYLQNPQISGGSGSAITALTGDVSATGPGSATATLANTAVTPGSYTNLNATIDSKGRITSASNGSSSGGVSQIVAGTNVTISPSGGTGVVTVNASGSGGSGGLCAATITNTASDLGAQINTAVSTLGSMGGNICVAAGTYPMSTAATINQLSISLIGAGSQAVIVNCTVAGDCLIVAPPLFNLTNSDAIGGNFRGFSIYGNAASGQNLIHTKDMIGSHWDDVFLDGASGTGQSCLFMEDVTAWTERNVMTNVQTGAHCTFGVKTSNNASNTFQPGSFGYNQFQFATAPTTGQVAFYATGNAAFYNGVLNLTANMTGGTAIKLDSQVATVAAETLILNVEKQGGAPVIWDVAGTNVHFNGWVSNWAGVGQGTPYSHVFNLNYQAIASYLTSNAYINTFGALAGVNSGDGSYILGVNSTCPNMTSTHDCIETVGQSVTSLHSSEHGWNDAAGLGFLSVFGGSTKALEWDGSGHLYSPTIATSPSTSPICPNGTNGAFTTSGCTSAGVTLSSVTPGATGSGTYDFSAATQVKHPVAAGFASAANGECGYDSTNNNWHCWVNGSDMIMLPLSGTFTTGHCGQPTLHGNTWIIDDAGGACGVSGGGSAFSAITSGTNANALVMGTGGSLGRSGTGTIDASAIDGVTVTGTPSAGQVPTTTSSSAATWQNVAVINITGTATITGCTTTNGNCVVTGTPASAIAISSIPGTCIDLEISYFGTNSTSSNVNLTATFNGDTGTNYDYTQIFGNAGSGTVSAASGNASNFAILGGLGQTGSFSGAGKIFIPQYASTTLQKGATATFGVGTSAQHQATIIGSATWHSTAAITAITLTPSSGTWTVGDAVVLRCFN